MASVMISAVSVMYISQTGASGATWAIRTVLSASIASRTSALGGTSCCIPQSLCTCSNGRMSSSSR